MEVRKFNEGKRGHPSSVIFSYDKITPKQLEAIKDYKYKIGDCVYRYMSGFSIWQIHAIDTDKKSVEHQSDLPNNNGKYFIAEYLNNKNGYYWEKEEDRFRRVHPDDLEEYEFKHTASRYNL